MEEYNNLYYLLFLGEMFILVLEEVRVSNCLLKYSVCATKTLTVVNINNDNGLSATLHTVYSTV